MRSETAAIPKVVFVLGAGSSHALGFPLGSQLKGELLTLLSPKNQLFEVLKNSGIPESGITAFARQLERAEFDTIDQHLREINDKVTREIGKRAVAYLIRMKESETALFHRDQKPRHWYKVFADHLARFRDHASPTQFSFITFNYDRSLPHYLYETLQHRGISATNLEIFLGPLNFHHVHGHVGELPWHLKVGGDSKAYFQYGATLSTTDLSSHIPEILLPDEDRDTGLMLARLVGDAGIITFVGFGFHEANMPRLPFGANTPPSSGVKRRYFSINPDTPPMGLLFEGMPIRHLNGNAEEIVPAFFRSLVSGNLLLD